MIVYQRYIQRIGVSASTSLSAAASSCSACLPVWDFDTTAVFFFDMGPLDPFFHLLQEHRFLSHDSCLPHSHVQDDELLPPPSSFFEVEATSFANPASADFFAADFFAASSLVCLDWRRWLIRPGVHARCPMPGRSMSNNSISYNSHDYFIDRGRTFLRGFWYIF